MTMDNSYFYKADEVRNLAKGQWLFILANLAPELEEAIKKAGKSHVTCPFHGGKKDFRMFKDAHETGGAICSCGAWHDGFELLMKARGWDFVECLQQVGDLLNATKHFKRQQSSNNKTKSVRTAKKVSNSSYVSHSAPDSYNEESRGDSNAPTEETESQVVQVVPHLAGQSKPWLMDLQDEMKRRAERERVYNAHLCEKIRKVWNECLPFNCEAAGPLRAYFVNRKLLFARDDVIGQTDSLRFHPSMSYYDEDGNEAGKFPAVVQAIRDPKGNLVTLHRTYLTKSGKKAKVECPKKMMPVPDGLSITGGAVRLGMPTEGVLGLAEGLETALSGFRATNIPTWSTVNATLLEKFEVPDELDIHTVVIFADKDRSLTGERSANVLKSKLEKQGYTVHILLPKMPIPPRSKRKGIDWNDVMINQGLMGFPPISTLREFIARRRRA